MSAFCMQNTRFNMPKSSCMNKIHSEIFKFPKFTDRKYLHMCLPSTKLHFCCFFHEQTQKFKAAFSIFTEVSYFINDFFKIRKTLTLYKLMFIEDLRDNDEAALTCHAVIVWAAYSEHKAISYPAVSIHHTLCKAFKAILSQGYEC